MWGRIKNMHDENCADRKTRISVLNVINPRRVDIIES